MIEVKFTMAGSLCLYMTEVNLHYIHSLVTNPSLNTLSHIVLLSEGSFFPPFNVDSFICTLVYPMKKQLSNI